MRGREREGCGHMREGKKGVWPHERERVWSHERERKERGVVT